MPVEANGENGDAQIKYVIDMDWFRENNRSFAVLASARLCAASQKKKPPKTDTGLLNMIRQCCSKEEGFITPDMPLAESVFRLLLANGNKPLTLRQIQARMQQRFSDITGSKDLSIPRLKRVLDRDRYYGLRATEEPGEEEPNTSPQSD